MACCRNTRDHSAQHGTGQGDGRGFYEVSHRAFIIQLEQPFVVRSVKGFIRRKQGDHEPLSNVLIEIQGPGNDSTIKRTTTNEHGRFRIGRVAEGTYKFKTTLNGFQSVMGTITVSKKAMRHDEIKIEVPVGV
jgi:hypothetical protein